MFLEIRNENISYDKNYKKLELEISPHESVNFFKTLKKKIEELTGIKKVSIVWLKEFFGGTKEVRNFNKVHIKTYQ